MADPFAGITDPQVQALLQALVSGQLSPGFASEVAQQFNGNPDAGSINLNPSITPGERSATAPFFNPQIETAAQFSDTGIGQVADFSSTPQQQQQFQSLQNEFSQVSPQIPSFTGLDALELFGPVLAGPVAGAFGGVAGAGAEAGAAGADAGAAGADIGAGAGAVGEGGGVSLASAGAGGADLSGAFADLGGNLGSQFGSLGSPGIAGLSSGATDALAAAPTAGLSLGASTGGGPGGGASGASALEGGSPSNTSPAPTTGDSSAFGNLGASNPITGQAPDATAGAAPSGATAGGAPSSASSPAFNPTTGTTGSPGSATGTSMDFDSPILGVANQAVSSTPAGMDNIAASNFAAENTSNPALTTSLENSGLSGPTPGGGFQGSDILKFIKANPSLALGGVGLGISALNKPKIPNINNLSADAASADQTANGLINAEQTGQLPPGQQQMVQSALSDSIAGIKAKYANMNLSGSSSEQQEISAAQERAAATTAQLATQVTGQGLTALQLSEQIYSQIANIKLQEDQGLQNAIAQFSGAAALGAGSQLIKSA